MSLIIGAKKNIPEKFYEEPLDGFFILCRERGCGYVACAFQEELNARFLWELAVKRFWYLKESYHEVFKNIWQ